MRKPAEGSRSELYPLLDFVIQITVSICDPPVAVNSSFLASVAALSALVLSPLRAQQFGILCLTVCVIQLLGLISFDVT